MIQRQISPKTLWTCNADVPIQPYNERVVILRCLGSKWIPPYRCDSNRCIQKASYSRSHWWKAQQHCNIGDFLFIACKSVFIIPQSKMTPILFITCRMRAVTLRGSRRMTLLLILLLWRFTSVHSVSACNVHPVHWRLTWSCGFPRKINHTFGVFITDDGKTSSWMMEKHHIRLLVEEKRRTNHHFHFLLKRPKQYFHANWRLLTFFLENYQQSWLLLLPTRNSPFRLLEATVFMQQFKKKIWSLKAKTQAQCKKRVELASLSTVTQLVQMIYFVSEKMYQSTKKVQLFWETLKCCIFASTFVSSSKDDGSKKEMIVGSHNH